MPVFCFLKLEHASPPPAWRRSEQSDWALLQATASGDGARSLIGRYSFAGASLSECIALVQAQDADGHWSRQCEDGGACKRCEDARTSCERGFGDGGCRLPFPRTLGGRLRILRTSGHLSSSVKPSTFENRFRRQENWGLFAHQPPIGMQYTTICSTNDTNTEHTYAPWCDHNPLIPCDVTESITLKHRECLTRRAGIARRFPVKVRDGMARGP
jgi:hypothetical protein